MKIVIDDYGASLKKKGNRFVITSEEKTEEFSSDKVSQIIILTGSSISTDAIKLASEKSIDVVCLERLGRPYARIYPCKLGGTTITRRNQLEAYTSAKGATLARSFVKAKVENMGYFLRVLGKSRDSNPLKDVGNSIIEYSKRLKISGGVDKIRNELLGIEGETSKKYFSTLKQVLPKELYSGSRSKRPPKDIFNAFLSYGYGILYSEVEKMCIISGLDPYLGFLHTDRYGKPSMVLDLIEEFRQPIVDRAMVTLAVRNQMGKDCVDVEKGVYLNKNGRKLAIEAMMNRLSTKIKYRGKNLSMQDIILKQAREIVKFVNDEIKEYTPFVYKW